MPPDPHRLVRALPLVDLAAGGGGFAVRAVEDAWGLRDRLGATHLAEAVTEDGCSCDFDATESAAGDGGEEERAQRLRALARARLLRDDVERARTQGPVAVYVCWHGGEAGPQEGIRGVTADWFLEPRLAEVEDEVLVVHPASH